MLEKQAPGQSASTLVASNQVDGGWVVQPCPTGAALHSIWGFDGTHVYAVSEEDNQRLFRFDGSQWTAVAQLPNARKFSVSGLGPNDVWAVGWCWDVVNYDGQNVNPSDCLNYLPGTAPIGEGIWGTSNTNILTVGVGGLIFRYDGGPGNLGERWTPMTSGVSVDLWDIWGTAAANVYAVGEFGTIIRFNGSNWVKVSNIPTIQSLNSIWGSSANDIFVVGDFGTILHYNGTSWSSQPSGTTEHLLGVWGCNAANVYAVGFNGTILRYNGTTWSVETSGTTASLLDVWGTANGMWAVGDFGTILKRTVPCI